MAHCLKDHIYRFFSLSIFDFYSLLDLFFLTGELWIKAFSKWYLVTPLRVALPEWKHVCLRLVDPRNGTLDFVVNDQLLVSREVKGAGGTGGIDLGVGGTRVGGGGGDCGRGFKYERLWHNVGFIV